MGCIASENRHTDQLTFHFAGIKRPKWYRTAVLKLPDAALIITINSSLTTSSTISNLKQLIRKTYKISTDKNILILYSHTVISNDDALTLQDFHITNNSLLLVAINADTEYTLSCPSPAETKLNYIEPEENAPNHHRRARFNFHHHVRGLMRAEAQLQDPATPSPPRSPIRRRIRRPVPLRRLPGGRLTLELPPDPVQNDPNNHGGFPFFHDDTPRESPVAPPAAPPAAPPFVLRRRTLELNPFLDSSDESDLDDASVPSLPTRRVTFAPIANPTTRRSPRHSPIASPPPIGGSSRFFFSGPTRQSPIHSPMASPPPLGLTVHSTQLPPFHTSRIHRPSPSPRPAPRFMPSIASMPGSSAMRNIERTPSPSPPLMPTFTMFRNTTETTRSPPTNPAVIINNHLLRIPTPHLSPRVLNHYLNNLETEEVKTDSPVQRRRSVSLPSPPSSPSSGPFIPLQHEKTHASVHSQSTFSSSSLDVSVDSTKPMKGFDIITQEDNVLVYKMPGCGHVMNRESLYEYALSHLSDHNNVYLKCPHSMDDAKDLVVPRGCWSCNRCTFINKNNRTDCDMCGSAKQAKKLICDTKWEYSQIKKILAPDMTAKGAITIEFEKQLAIKLAKLELCAARNVVENECNVQKCAGCETLYFREKDDSKWMGRKINKEEMEKMFKTDCVLCANYSFCWGCGVEYENGHFCDSSFRSELVEILKEAEAKKVGEVEAVPSIRCCPNCCQLINHSEACKHMKCKACKTDFCFICLKPKKDGNWQCGSHSDPCPVAPRQNGKTLPDSVVINKKAFKLSF